MEGDEIKELKKLLRENISYSKKIFENSQKTRKYIMTLQVINLIKLILILVPIVLALIYLPPLISSIVGDYKDLFLEIGKLRPGEIERVDPNVIKNILP